MRRRRSDDGCPLGRTLAVVGLALWMGCSSASVQRARPVGDGRWQVSATAAGGAVVEQGAQGPVAGTSVVGLGAGVRRGVGEHAELLVEAGASVVPVLVMARAGVGARWIPWVSDGFAAGLDLRTHANLGPGVFASARLAAPVGVRFPEGGELVITPSFESPLLEFIPSAGLQLTWIQPVRAGASAAFHVSATYSELYLARWTVGGGVGFLFGDPYAH